MFEIFLRCFCILGCPEGSGVLRLVRGCPGVFRRCSLGGAECSGDFPGLFQVLQTFVTRKLFPMKSETMDSNR